jgi:hypothetical protein
MSMFRIVLMTAFLLLGVGSVNAATMAPAPVSVTTTTSIHPCPTQDSPSHCQQGPLIPNDPLPPNKLRLRGAIYARFSMRYQASIADQVRACREWAEANGLDISEAMIFIDEAVSGKKSRRAGLDAP